MREKKFDKNKSAGITIISLVVTIIVLLILAGISLNMLAGNNGVIKHTISAKEKSEISDEKEHLEVAILQAMEKNKYGSLTKTGLSTKLEEIKDSMPTSVESDEELNLLFVTFTNSGRVYQVNSDGDVTYLGNEAELKNSATVIASHESSTTPQLVQYVDLKVETFVGLEDDEIFVHYVWTNSENKTPSNTDYAAATCNVNSNKKRRSVTLTTEDTAEGNYYLWVQVVFNENTITKKYGPYAVKDHTTLVATNKETAADSGFLGNIDIPRNKIRSVTIKNSFGTHGADEKSWDVSASQDRTYLAWSKATTDATDGTYYDVVIEGKGGVVANTNASYLFANIGSGLTKQDVTITGLEYLDTGLATSMQSMFSGCKSISLDVIGFNTSKVTNMYGMFDGCKRITNLNLGNFDTSNVTTMRQMFRSCEQLNELNLNKFDTREVTSMSELFNGCKNLTTLDVAKFNTNNVTNMYMMFCQCNSLTSLNLENFNTKSVTNMGHMFSGCKTLTNLNVNKFNTSSVKSMNNMFSNCSGLTSLDLNNFDTKNVDSMASMFYGCEKLTNVYISGFDTTNVTSMSYMFRNCKNLVDLNLSNFDTAKVIDMNCMFYSCKSLRTVNLSCFNTSNVTKMSSMFYGCENLSKLNLDNFNTLNITDMTSMFQSCYSLTNLSLTNFNTSNITNMTSMFAGCMSLKTLDLSMFNTSNVTNMHGMFAGNSELVTIYIGNKWDVSNVINSDSMFYQCYKITGDKSYDSSYVDKTYATKTGGYMTYKPST